MKVLIVTGTPATGKTTLSKKLAKKLNFHYLDVNKVIKKYNISEGYDKKRKTRVVDIKKLNKALVKEINNYKKLIQSNIKKIPIIGKSNKKIPFNMYNQLIKNNYKKISIKDKKSINDKIGKIKNGIVI